MQGLNVKLILQGVFLQRFSLVFLCCAILGSSSIRGERIFEVFEAIRWGHQLDLNDPHQRDVLELYLHLARSETGAYSSLASAHIMGDMIYYGLRDGAVQPKEYFPSYKFITPHGTRILRPFSLLEAPFRGFWGGDCSSSSRPLRGWEPAHLVLAMESEDGSPLGQMELILGEEISASARSAAFLERFQSPRNLSVEDVALFLFGIHKGLSTRGTSLVTLPTLDRYNILGHPLSNYTKLTSRIEDALERFFDRNPVGPFTRFPTIWYGLTLLRMS